MRTRARVSTETKLAAALFARGEVPYEHAKLMTAAQFNSLYHYDHNRRHAEDGSAEFWNLAPMLIAEHRKKTATIDIPTIAKGKRIRAKQAVHEGRMLPDRFAPVVVISLEKLERGYPSRKSPKRKIASRGFDKTRTRTFSGKVVPRKERRR